MKDSRVYKKATRSHTESLFGETVLLSRLSKVELGCYEDLVRTYAWFSMSLRCFAIRA